MRRARLNPIPEPSRLVVKNGTNNCSSTAGARPGPLLATSMWHKPSCSVQLISIRGCDSECPECASVASAGRLGLMVVAEVVEWNAANLLILFAS